jgi:hypothetical protein
MSRRKKPGKYEFRRARFGHMPPLRHWPDRSKPFDTANSEVCQWLAGIEPRVPTDRLFEQVKSAGAIIFDQSTGTWRGCYFGVSEAGLEAAEKAK